MAELSARSGVPSATIRYYLREGLLPPGRLTSRNQATYDEHHLHRLALIRAMVEVGGMPLAAVGALFGHLEATGADEHTTLGMVQYALVREQTGPADTAEEHPDVKRLVDRLGWQVRGDHPARSVLSATLSTLQRLGWSHTVEQLNRYAQAAHTLAEADVPLALARTDRDQRAEAVVIVGVLGDAMLSALRRMAEEDVTTTMSPPRSPALTPAHHTGPNRQARRRPDTRR